MRAVLRYLPHTHTLSTATLLSVTPPKKTPAGRSFKIAKLDVMAMGAPDASVSDIVANIIKENVLKVRRLYLCWDNIGASRIIRKVYVFLRL